MTSVLDIVRIHEEVEVGGQTVKVYGLSTRAIADLLQKFPDLQLLVAGRSELDAKGLMAIAPDAVSSILAAALGEGDNPETIALCDQLPMYSQMSIMEAVIKLTMPGGINPFVQKLTALMGGVSGEPGKAPAGSLPRRQRA